LVLTLLGSGVDGDGWHWTAFDFIVIGAVLFSVGLTYELIARKSNALVYRVAFGLGLLGALLLFWVNGAVGIIGNEDNPANLLYGAVFAVGLIGSLMARFKPRGMARTLFTAAFVQMLIPAIALIFWNSSFAPDVVRVFVLNAGFALLFVISGLLFRRSS
jgi:hypothetical protein